MLLEIPSSVLEWLRLYSYASGLSHCPAAAVQRAFDHKLSRLPCAPVSGLCVLAETLASLLGQYGSQEEVGWIFSHLSDE